MERVWIWSRFCFRLPNIRSLLLCLWKLLKNYSNTPADSDYQQLYSRHKHNLSPYTQYLPEFLTLLG